MPPIAPMDFEFRGRIEDELNRAGRTLERVMPRIQRAITTRVTI